MEEENLLAAAACQIRGVLHPVVCLREVTPVGVYLLEELADFHLEAVYLIVVPDYPVEVDSLHLADFEDFDRQP